MSLICSDCGADFTDLGATELADHEERHKPTRTWNCEKCGRLVERYRGMDDVTCECGAEYNSFGQRLRDDWRGNPSNYDSDIGDMEGFEMQQLEKESHDY